ncbi:MAG TPA: DUF3604 domain-containing protein, partial [Candidatus Glassbacteria bacterium]|nr:DUF3604 domain-containing protein [Candidatus Glassbacteria bacterium]
MHRNINRRKWIAGFTSLFAAGGLFSKIGCKPTDKAGSPAAHFGDFHHYFGDLHNHSEMGYASGSLERVFDIAAGRLDFLAHTPHSHWPDVPRMPGGMEKKWLDGFAATRRLYPRLTELNREYHNPGRFVTFQGYEWHSSFYGDFCIVFPGDDSPLTHYYSLKDLQDFTAGKNAFLIPHHPAYLRGHRGANPEHWDGRITRHLEIYSEHGNAENDEGPLDYIRHSMGGRWTPNTLQAILASGRRVGVLASSDNHLGCPGAYGEGLAVVLARELTRESLFEALGQRRCYGVSGDRIRLDFAVNGRLMGEEIAYSPAREIDVEVSGWDRLEQVEVLKNNRVVHREFPDEREMADADWSRPLLVRLELGWGPWASLGSPRTCDWELEVKVEGGTLAEVQTCFQSGPLDETRRDRITDLSASVFKLTSFTSRLEA